ncbi:nudix hydrolase 2 isoform X2 [Lathyrus oleraceus]|uniref:nudix hydrolase 2 isoform X2 n=1 Tax=Pisum sativum TaxID=3888 RepID=UPI0021CE2154|nr:nudix hydrolase 2-like isoform X2 [Pisum sativum]
MLLNALYLQQPEEQLQDPILEIGVTTPTRIRCMSTSPISSQNASEAQVQRDKLLTSTDDYYGGVIVELDQPMDSTTFVSILRASILHWKQLGKKGVWIKLPIHLVSLAEALVKEGFWYHHAEPNYLMLVNWIPESPNTIPANATHRVGISSFVVNEKHEVLVVQENSGQFQGTGVWKFPTGVVDQGEDICVAAVREVKEETGVDSEFEEVLAFRQSHNSFFAKSDLFFLCLLRPLSSEIQIQNLELEGAQDLTTGQTIGIAKEKEGLYYFSDDHPKWMPFVEYTAQPIMQKSDLLKCINNICLAKVDGRYSGYTPVSTLSNFSDQQFYMYMNAEALKKSNS